LGKPGLPTLRRRILNTRNIYKPKKTTPETLIPRDGKTAAMLLAEHRYGDSIEHLLLSGTVRVVGRRLGVTASTVSRWRHKLGIGWTPDNLPLCSLCQSGDLTCQLTKLCHVLVEFNDKDVARVKYIELGGDAANFDDLWRRR
jgi:hypothetical protein